MVGFGFVFLRVFCVLLDLPAKNHRLSSGRSVRPSVFLFGVVCRKELSLPRWSSPNRNRGEFTSAFLSFFSDRNYTSPMRMQASTVQRGFATPPHGAPLYFIETLTSRACLLIFSPPSAVLPASSAIRAARKIVHGCTKACSHTYFVCVAPLFRLCDWLSRFVRSVTMVIMIRRP